MLGLEVIHGSVVISNVSGSTYAVEELGDVTFAMGEQIDLCDPDNGVFYEDFEAALRLVTTVNASKLWTDLQAGKLSVVSYARPFGV